MKNITLSEKLIIYFLLLGLGTISLVSIYSYYSTQAALMNRTFDQLTSLRIAKKNQVEIFFRDRIKDIILLSGSDDTRNITESSKETSARITEKKFTAYLEKYRSLTGYFSSVSIIGKNNKFFIKGFTDGSGIQSGEAHFDFPVLSPGIINDNPEQHILIRDEVPDQRLGKAKMFMEAPVISANKTLSGMIIFELPTDAINTIMLNNDPNSGLGLTGETYLVGKDYKMRSSSRFIRNSILHTTVRTLPVLNAIQGLEGQVITRDYRSIPVLSSYSSLKIPGLKWFILAEIDLKEAMIPITRMRNNLLLLSSLLSVIFFIFVFIISKRITRPIIQLKEAALKVGKGDYDIDVPVRSNDEIGSLTRAFNQMSVQIKEKTKELQDERTGRLRSVIDAEEKERQRLSREIHDGIGQSLIALKLRLESLIYMNGPEIKENILLLRDQFDSTIDEIRRISNNLMPSVLEVFGITTALKNLCEETEDHAGIKVIYEATGELENMNTRTKTYLYRIAQEAVNNIIRHSEARHVSITLSRSEDIVTFIIRDDGKGFTPGDPALESGNGLHNMHDRVGLMQGTFDLISSPGQGTKIIIYLPVN